MIASNGVNTRDTLPLAILPSNESVVVNVPEKRRRLFRNRLMGVISAAAAKLAGPNRNAPHNDDEQIVELFLDVLGRDDRFEVQTAQTGYDAGMLTEQFKPHLILLDYMLPDINGNVVCDRIRANPDMSSTKIIIVSGVVKPDEIDGLLRSGADDFVKKPFNIGELVERVAELLEV